MIRVGQMALAGRCSEKGIAMSKAVSNSFSLTQTTNSCSISPCSIYASFIIFSTVLFSVLLFKLVSI